jgi:hypothetical protein
MNHYPRPFEVMGKALCFLLIFTMAGGCGAVDDEGISFCGVPAGNGENATPESRAEYPSGPYGLEICSVIDNLSFTLDDESEYTFQDIRADPTRRLLLISTSAGWCTACIEEQPALEALYDARNEEGLEVMVALFQDSNFAPATPLYAKNWKEQYDLDLTIVIDPASATGDTEFALSPYYNTALTPMNMLVDLESMTILEIILGWDKNRMTTIIDAML